MTETIFVTLQTEDLKLKDLQKRIDKISLIQIWIMKASALFERYFRTLDLLNVETDSVKRGLLVEEIEVYFMSSVSYFLRSFLSQKGSYSLEIKNVTDDSKLRAVYEMLMALRNEEYVHWKGARSTVSVKYSFRALSDVQCEFAKDIQTNFSDTVGPAQQSDEIRQLFKATLQFIDQRRNKDLEKMRERLTYGEPWQTTQLLNDKGEAIIKKS